jgi:hypothetical protein
MHITIKSRIFWNACIEKKSRHQKLGVKYQSGEKKLKQGKKKS